MEKSSEQPQPIPSPVSNHKKAIIIIFGIFIIILYIILNVTVWIVAKNKKQGTKPGQTAGSLTPTPTPRPLISRGTYDFSVSTGGGTASLISQGKIDPIDPIIGNSQSIEITSIPNADKLQVKIQTDTKVQIIPLSKSPSFPQVWTGSWTMNDTYSYVYTIPVSGDVNGKTVSVPMMFR